jgi:hypothetical protein
MDNIILKTVEEKSAFFRGSIIQSSIEVELRMDIIIGRFLSSNNQEKTLDTIGIFDNAESIGFHTKNLAIQYIIKKYFIGFLKENKKLLEDINTIIKIRNLVAHKRPEFNKNDYSVLSWAKTSKNSVGTKSYNINKETCLEYENLSAEVFIKLVNLECLVTERAKNE